MHGFAKHCAHNIYLEPCHCLKLYYNFKSYCKPDYYYNLHAYSNAGNVL
jgi:hypothetical protein